MKKKCDINKQNHTIPITNQYDPNVDYYEHKEKLNQLSRIKIRNLKREREKRGLNNGNREKSI
jgi:hypothetical protein